MKPIEEVGAWMFRVARNRIIDLFRKQKVQSLSEESYGEDGDAMRLEDLLPSPREVRMRLMQEASCSMSSPRP